MSFNIKQKTNYREEREMMMRGYEHMLNTRVGLRILGDFLFVNEDLYYLYLLEGSRIYPFSFSQVEFFVFKSFKRNS